MLETRKVYYTGERRKKSSNKTNWKMVKESLGFNIGDTMQLIKDKNIIIL